MVWYEMFNPFPNFNGAAVWGVFIHAGVKVYSSYNRGNEEILVSWY